MYVSAACAAFPQLNWSAENAQYHNVNSATETHYGC